jgi:DNA-binding transcriptional LysR family regulator
VAASRRTPGRSTEPAGSRAGTRSELRVGFVPGVTPDRWARAWAERMPRSTLQLVPLPDDDPVALLRAGRLDMALVRLPVDRDGLHVIPLYDEQPVVVVSREHPVSTYDRIDLADLSEENLLQDPDVPVPRALEVVAADAGIVIVPMSLARLHHRKDVVSVPVDGVPTTTVALAWLRETDDDWVQTFIGVVRGRTVNSSRGR